jgi:hypothetical protein
MQTSTNKRGSSEESSHSPVKKKANRGREFAVLGRALARIAKFSAAQTFLYLPPSPHPPTTHNFHLRQLYPRYPSILAQRIRNLAYPPHHSSGGIQRITPPTPPTTTSRLRPAPVVARV